MSYQTGTATSASNFLQILSTFLVTAGYTINRQDNDGEYERLNFEKNGFNYNIYASAVSIFLTLSSSYSAVAKGSQTDETEEGISSNGRCQIQDLSAGAFPSYHIFYDQDFVHAVIEDQSGVYRHLCFGEIAKYGTWTGGAYIDTVYWSIVASQIDVPSSISSHSKLAHGYNSAHPSSMHLNYDRDLTNTYVSQSSSSSSVDMVLSGSGIEDSSSSIGNMYVFHKVTPTSQTLKVISTPLELYVSKGTAGLKEIMGYIPFTRSVNIEFLNPLDVVDTDWIVFPVIAKKDPSLRDDTYNSGNYGYAIKKVI